MIHLLNTHNIEKLKRFLRSYRSKWLLTKGTPSSRNFGYDRGKTIGRYYGDKFIESNMGAIKGSVLEIGVPVYASKYSEKVTHCDVLDVIPDNPKANLVGDLDSGKGIPKSAYDCVIMTGVYLYTFDIHSAVRNTYMAVRPGGVLLAVLPGISQVYRSNRGNHGDYWHFTDASALRLFGENFGDNNINIQVFGNVLTASAYLHGLSSDEFTHAQLNALDTDYQVCIGVRAIKQKAP